MREIAGAAVAPSAETTRDIYARIVCGGADVCNCLACRNYRMVRDEAYPPDFRALLDELGVDYTKELEVYFGFPQPDGSGLHHYEGWFTFAGRVYGRDVEPAAESGAFTYRIEDPAPAPQKEFGDASVVTLWFATLVPWRLGEPWSLETYDVRPF